MISEIVIYSTVASAATAAAFVGMPYLDRAVRWASGTPGSPEPAVEEAGPKDLSDPAIRDRMTAFLANHEIVGDADVRGGRFFAPVPVSKLAPLAREMRRAWDRIQRLGNPAACSLYVRDSVHDRFTPLEIDGEDIGEILRVIERVAEDRRKSRSLYKGVTDEEINNLAVAAVVRWLKDHGEFDEAMLAQTPHRSAKSLRDIAVATAALELAFQIKRAEA